MATTSLRSTVAITTYVELSDELAALKLRQKQIERQQEALKAEVLEQIGDRREVRVNKQVRILEPHVEEKISRAVSDEIAVEFCKQHGLTFSTRTPEYVAPATFSKYVREDRLPEEFVERKLETVIVIL
jgi:hypothetical protein